MHIPVCLAIFQTCPENMRCINNTWYLKGNIEIVANLTHRSLRNDHLPAFIIHYIRRQPEYILKKYP